MKPQDLIFLIGLTSLLVMRRQRLLPLVGLACILAAIPLFAVWKFFTAQRLIEYAAVCFTAVIMFEWFSRIRSSGR